MKTKYKDRFGETICDGHTIRPYQDGMHGRPAIVRFNKERFVIDIPDYENDVDIDDYFEDGISRGWEFEIVKPYPNAEPFKGI